MAQLDVSEPYTDPALAERRHRGEQARHLLAEPTGLVLAKKGPDGEALLGVSIAPAPNGLGRWRVTTFDEDGFSGHRTCGSKMRAVLLALQEGYTDSDRGLLRRLFRTDRFQEGLQRAQPRKVEPGMPAPNHENYRQTSDWPRQSPTLARFRREAPQPEPSGPSP